MPANRVTSNNPWHIVLVLDDSGSMAGQPAQDVSGAVTAMVEELKLMSNGVKPYFKLSVIKFGSHPSVLAEAASEQAVDATKIAALDGSSGGTDATSALEEAATILQRNPGKPTDFVPYVFFLSDGVPDNETSALEAGNRIKTLALAAGNPHLVTIGFGDVRDSFMSSLATNPELYKRLPSSKDIVRLFPAIGTIAGTAAGAGAVDQAIINL